METFKCFVIPKNLAFFEIGKKGEELVSSSGIFQGNHEKYTRHFLKK